MRAPGRSPANRLHRVLVPAFLLSAAIGTACAQDATAPAETPQQIPTTPLTAPAPTPAPAPAAASTEDLPLAVVALDSDPTQAAAVTGAIQVSSGRATIGAAGSVTSGLHTAEVILPRRGTLHVCSATTVNLASDTSTPPGALPGLLLAMDHGAVEMSFASVPADANANILMTPDFRIIISGAGASEIKVRLAEHGDTCIDNSGKDTPYLVVSSLFDGGVYRVLPGQHIMLLHGSLQQIVDEEKEPCGCPPSPNPVQAFSGNEFPLAQSEGLAPTPGPPPTPPQPMGNTQVVPPLVYSGGHTAAPPPVVAKKPEPEPEPAQTPSTPAPPKKKPGALARIGRFFRKIFGAD